MLAPAQLLTRDCGPGRVDPYSGLVGDVESPGDLRLY